MKLADIGNQMITSKLTSKAQTTIPQAVRKALRLQQGEIGKISPEMLAIVDQTIMRTLGG